MGIQYIDKDGTSWKDLCVQNGGADLVYEVTCTGDDKGFPVMTKAIQVRKSHTNNNCGPPKDDNPIMRIKFLEIFECKKKGGGGGGDGGWFWQEGRALSTKGAYSAVIVLLLG